VPSVGTGPTVSLERPGHLLAPGGVSPQHGRHVMPNRTEGLIRQAYQAYTSGDSAPRPALTQILSPSATARPVTRHRPPDLKMQAGTKLAIF
jgi:hypothetical protein